MTEQETSTFPTHKKETIFIGVAWPYANGFLHLGHVAGSLLSPDIFSRYHRMIGNRVLMVSGSDEHGTPITVRAENEGKSPQEVVDFFHAQTCEDLKRLHIHFDLFTRTTHPNHYNVVQDLFLTLYDRGYIFPKTTTELYCIRCDKFLPDRYVNGQCPHCNHDKARGDQCDSCGKTYNAVELLKPICKFCGSKPVPRETEHFFFRLSDFSDRLLAFLEHKQHWKSRVLNFTRNWILGGLRDRPITRDISWGIPVPLPGYESKRIYVWFDAVTGYLAASKQWAAAQGNPDAWKEFWQNPSAKSYYFLGKDNIPFHTIIWPAMLMGYGDGKGENFNTPYDVPANEYLRLEGEKFTKSGGIGIEVSSFMKEYTSDEVRYYLSIIMPENRDVDFNLEEFKIHVNNELVATFGNFIHRVLSFTGDNFGIIPPRYRQNDTDDETIREITLASNRIGKLLETCQFKNALKEIMALAAYGNRYLVERAPWKLIKTDRNECATVLNVGLRLVKALSIFAYPFIPEAMARLHAILGFPSVPNWNDAAIDFSSQQYSMQLERPKPLFRQLEITKKDITQVSETSKQKPEKNKSRKKKKSVPQQIRNISIQNLDLRVGYVLEVNDHPNAEKLFVLSIDVGEDEPRTLVAGLKPHYLPQELREKSLIILCNLKPAKLRGIVSQGMLLAAANDETVCYLTPEAPVPSGTELTLFPEKESEILEEITIQEFASIPFRIRKVKEIVEDRILFDDTSSMVTNNDAPEDLTGKNVIHAHEMILMAGDSPVVPEREIEAGASIR